MHPLIEDKLPAVHALCQQFRVRALYLFGSATRADFDPARSDLDFLVEFEPRTPGDRARDFFAFEAALSALFDRPVDLGEIDGIRNDRLRARIEQSRVPIYAAA